MQHVAQSIPMPVMLGEQERACASHGVYTDRLVRYGAIPGELWVGCPKCMQASLADESRRFQLQQRNEARAQALAVSGIPDRFKAARMADLTPDVRVPMESWLANPVGPLVVLGGIGTGKTYAIAALLSQAAFQGRSPVYITVSGYLRAIRDTWDQKGREASVTGRAAAAQILAIDEIGIGTISEGDLIRVHDLLAARYDSALPTIYCSNLAPTALEPAIGNRAFDRMCDGATLIKIVGRSRRRPL